MAIVHYMGTIAAAPRCLWLGARHSSGAIFFATSIRRATGVARPQPLLGDVLFLGHRQGLGLGRFGAALGERGRQLLLELGHLVHFLGLVDVGVLLHAGDQRILEHGLVEL